MKNAAATLKAKSKRKPAPQRIAQTLHESMDLSAAQVDRDACVIRNVKVVGRYSQNRHGMPGAQKTEYTPAYHKKALERQLYENAQVNLGHPPKNTPTMERDPRDRFGALFNQRVINDETFADWQLIPSHEMTPTILDCAENPRLHGQFALSHNANAYGNVREGVYEIDEPNRVISVDVVTRGGCNRTLFESKEPTMPQKQKLQDVLESADADVQARFAKLFEMDDTLGDLPIDPPAPAEGAEKAGWMEHFAEMIKAIIGDESMDAATKIEKVMNAMKSCMEEKEGKKEEEAPAAKESADDDEQDDAAKKQSLLEAKEREEYLALRAEKQARSVCESLQFLDPTPIQIKAIAALPGEKDRKALAQEFKDARRGTAAKGKAPHTSTVRTLLESAQSNTKPKTERKAFAESIKS